LRTRSCLWGDLSPEFWSRSQAVSIPVDSVPSAATLVASGEAEAFHHCIAGVVSAGVELPVIGVFVWQDTIELDYRMGKEWGPHQVAGFFELLRECCALDPGASVVPAKGEGPLYPDQFVNAWRRFNAQVKDKLP